uniref:CRAL-TRIO domain-containing protein n=1 Tax=Proboscia inermis TaxID=420281 RepID=A0A7S0G8Y4_9STRA|mmetsp:Transcript_13472/g.13677  ORF Transcript_13472/g.13677 Transcript_13472/m.13677 type:complete len:135 (+) Transcript_13472:289-693(+)
MIAFILETCKKSMDPDDPYARVYVIIDFQGISKFNADLRKVAAFARVIAKYPERVVGVGVNADLVTMVMWAFLSPLLDKRTRDRMTIFGSNFKPFLEEHIGLDQIGPTLGGNRMEEYPPMSTQTAQKFKWNPTV